MKNTITLPLHVTRFMLFIYFLLAHHGLLQAQTTRFVMPVATGTGNGSSWTNASADLQLMINNSAAGDSIFVAAGVYIPNRPANATGTIDVNNRNNAFVLKTDVKIYGGFAGTETSVAERILNTGSPSVLSGDIGTVSDTTDNCFHVVIATGPMGIALLDGFTITGGNAGIFPTNSSITVNGNPIGRFWGGGLHCYLSAPLIRNCIFSGNAADYGGGAYAGNASPTYITCTFSANNARKDGGGMYNSNTAAPTITNCTFLNNTTGTATVASGYGGGIYNGVSAAPVITGCTFSYNIGGSSGGAIFSSSSSSVITNCHFTGNRSRFSGGGAISNNQSPSVSITDCSFNNNETEGFGSGAGIQNIGNVSCTIARCTFTGNKAVYNGGGISNASNVTITDCRFEGNEATREGGGANNSGSVSGVGFTINFINCIFSGNISGQGGGGICNSPMAMTYITNCTISGNNTANNSSYGGGIHNSGVSPVITSCIISGNGSGIMNQGAAAPTITYSIVQGGYAGTGNSNADPLFINAPSYTGAPFTGGDYSLQNCSPAVNAGNTVSPNASTDLAAQPRMQAGRVDMGAYESPFTIATAGMAMTDTVIIAFQSNTGNTPYATLCNKLAAALTGDGTATSVQGNTTIKLWIAAVQPADYVKRHFEITPQAVDPTTATATVTLYFTQSEFDDFNVINAIKLPTGPTDVAGLARLRIEKRSGSSSDNTGLPDSYPGAFTMIDPDDANIVWNAAALRWEVSFAVSGFSGFFVKSGNSTLPLRLVNFQATEKNCTSTLQWTTTDETQVSHFAIEQSTDGIVFSNVKTIAAKNSAGENRYTLSLAVMHDHIFYRLKIVDIDGTTKYSAIAAVKASCSNQVTVTPNPASDKLHLKNAVIGSPYAVYDNTGKMVISGRIGHAVQGIAVAHLTAGVYYINLFMQGGNSRIVRFIKE